MQNVYAEKKAPMMIYLDHNATTPLDPLAFEVLADALQHVPANASSVHRAGQKARSVIDDARERVANTLQAQAREIVFTSGGTESDNLALRGLWATRRAGRRKIVLSAVEHPAVLETARALEREGAELALLPVDEAGRLAPEGLESALDDDTAFVSVMWANNETGVVHPIGALGLLCRNRGIPFHVDAVQAFGRLPIDVQSAPVDLLSLSAHKIYGAKGAGALWIRAGLKIAPLLTGGLQERGLRGGTENVGAIAAFGVAATLAAERLSQDNERIAALRDSLQGALERLPDARVIGGSGERLSNTLNIAFKGVETEALLMGLDIEGICVSGGSACTSGSLEPSSVLTAMGVAREWSRGAVRFSLGRGNTTEEISQTALAVERLLPRLRAC